MVLNSIIYAAAKKRKEQQGKSENVMHEFLRETCALPIEAKLNGISCCRRRRRRRRCLCLLCLDARFPWNRRKRRRRRRSRKNNSSTTWQGLCLAAKRKRRCCFMRKVTNTANTPRSTETTIYRVYTATHTHTHVRNSVGICVCAWVLLNIVGRLSKIAANERWYTICSGRRQQYN